MISIQFERNSFGCFGTNSSSKSKLWCSNNKNFPFPVDNSTAADVSIKSKSLSECPCYFWYQLLFSISCVWYHFWHPEHWPLWPFTAFSASFWIKNHTGHLQTQPTIKNLLQISLPISPLILQHAHARAWASKPDESKLQQRLLEPFWSSWGKTSTAVQDASPH